MFHLWIDLWLNGLGGGTGGVAPANAIIDINGAYVLDINGANIVSV